MGNLMMLQQVPDDFCVPYPPEHMGSDLADPDPFEILAARTAS